MEWGSIRFFTSSFTYNIQRKLAHRSYLFASAVLTLLNCVPRLLCRYVSYGRGYFIGLRFGDAETTSCGCGDPWGRTPLSAPPN